MWAQFEDVAHSNFNREGLCFVFVNKANHSHLTIVNISASDNSGHDCVFELPEKAHEF